MTNGTPEPANDTLQDDPVFERPTFIHPQWSVGIVIMLGLVSLLLGLGNPLWLLGGSPFILTLAVWVVVRVVQWRRRARDHGDGVLADEPRPDV